MVLTVGVFEILSTEMGIIGILPKLLNTLMLKVTGNKKYLSRRLSCETLIYSISHLPQVRWRKLGSWILVRAFS